MKVLPEQAKPKIVVIDDEESILSALRVLLVRWGYEVCAVSDPIEGLAAVGDTCPDVVMLDIRMPHLSGMQLLQELKREHPGVEVIMMTAHATVETALQAVKSGAHDYLTKPFDNIEVVGLAIKKALDRKRLLERNRALEEMLVVQDRFEDLTGKGLKMQAVYRLIESVAPSSATILIQGESGTGKELVARAIHRRGPRRDRPFVAVNCSAFSESLLESELFGHSKGAFTGAIGSRKGLFEAAQGGTVFLDEIGDVSPAMQVRLLRVLQEGEVRRVGSNETVKVDARVIAASHIDLQKAKSEGRFREDLYYRLNVVTVALPPLRERPEDVPTLAYHFLALYSRKLAKRIVRISPEVLEAFTTNRWTGNVRELENVMERAVLLTSTEEISLDDLPSGFSDHRSSAEVASSSLAHLRYAEAKTLAVRAFERRYLSTLLQRAEGNISSAARSAGLDRSNFRRLLRQHEVSVPEQVEERE